MSGVKPGCEDRAAAAAVEIMAASFVDAAEKLVGEVKMADLGVRLEREGWDYERRRMAVDRVGEEPGE